jgi:hypothetical protein
VSKNFHASIDSLKEQVRLLVQELDKESDRGVALIAAACLDHALEALLRGFFVLEASVPPGLKHGDLLGTDRPVGTLSARMKLACLCGLIGPESYHDIDTIRKIRNLFSHGIEPLSFEDSQIRDLCKNLSLVFKGDTVDDSGRQRFVAGVKNLIFHLFTHCFFIEPRSIGEELPTPTQRTVGKVS